MTPTKDDDLKAAVERLTDHSLRQVEAAMIAHRISVGSMSQAAATLGIGRSTLYRKVREYQLDAALLPPAGDQGR